MKNEEENFFDRKQDRKKKFQTKIQKKDLDNSDEYIVNKKHKHKIKEKKEHLKEEEWEDWDRYYNH